MKKKVNSLLEILKVSTKLGLTSFGGPIAHLGFFKSEYIDRKKWLDEKLYADILALCQFLPGPASSQVGIAIGTIRGGIFGGIIAWLGFTMPSAIAMLLFALVYKNLSLGDVGWIHGLKVVAVAIVAHAVWGMGRKLAADRPRITIAIITTTLTLIFPSALTQIVLIIAAGITGVIMYDKAEKQNIEHIDIPVSKRAGIIAWILFFGMLIALPVARQLIHFKPLAVFDTFYRVGSLVFGGGHVVLPLLEREVVPVGWMTAEEFLAGYGAVQAVPGPLFTFSSYLGAMINGVGGAALTLSAIFLPSFLLIVGSLPFLNEVRKKPKFQAALTGINAAVVGILLAALYDPVWVSSIKGAVDFAVAAVLFVLLEFWKVSPWIVVLAGAAAGFIVHIL
ncbi:MAG: chromate efflux transporter [Bacillota bacterium]